MLIVSTLCSATLLALSPHLATRLDCFPFICNFHVVAADLAAPSLNYISIQAVVALVMAAMVTLSSLYRWSGQNVGVDFLLG